MHLPSRKLDILNMDNAWVPVKADPASMVNYEGFVGFFDEIDRISYFIKVFRRCTGGAPSETPSEAPKRWC